MSGWWVDSQFGLAYFSDGLNHQLDVFQVWFYFLQISYSTSSELDLIIEMHEVCCCPPFVARVTSTTQEIHAADYAFAALLADRTVVTWGHSGYGGNCQISAVEQASWCTNKLWLLDVLLLQSLQMKRWSAGGLPALEVTAPQCVKIWRGWNRFGANDSAFAALLANGKVVTWGFAPWGGNSDAVQSQLRNVVRIYGNKYAFAAKRSDETVITWGDHAYGGRSTAVETSLRTVQEIYSTDLAFAAVLADRSLVTWGHAACGGNATAVQPQLYHVKEVYATRSAFAVLRFDGSVVTWGDTDDGGDSASVQGRLRNVQHIEANDHAFAAILGNRTVVTWGDRRFGGDCSKVQDKLRNVQQIYPTLFAFAAVLSDGGVVTWGDQGEGSDLEGLFECVHKGAPVSPTPC